MDTSLEEKETLEREQLEYRDSLQQELTETVIILFLYILKLTKNRWIHIELQLNKLEKNLLTL